jgi:hypothetical protein
VPLVDKIKELAYKKTLFDFLSNFVNKKNRVELGPAKRKQTQTWAKDEGQKLTDR